MVAFSALVPLALAALSLAVQVNVGTSGGNATSPLQYGIMFEARPMPFMLHDINHSGDGGIYAELIRNRAFQGNAVFPSTIYPWEPINDAILTLQNTSRPLSSALPTSLNVAASESRGYYRGESRGQIGIRNPGWWGIDVQPQTYTGTFYTYGGYSGYFTASLQSDITNETFASTRISSRSSPYQWTEHQFTLHPTTAAANSNNSFSITFNERQCNGSLNFNFISLFPPTYNNRPNGMRIDLMEALRELAPSYLRMPGGNNIEGNVPPYRWIWNNTIGPLIDRPGRPGTWGYENTDGLGLADYLNWCVDLNMEPILAVWDGLYLGGTVIPEADLAPYVQDTLNELEYILGSTDTYYGAMRASDGHPEPWTVNYVEIGNEDNLSGGESSYVGYRFEAYYNAIKSVYPNMTVIASTTAISLPDSASAVGDYHIYTRPDDFVSRFNYFDQNTTAHKTLVGEWAIIQPNIPGGGGADFSVPRSPWPFWIGTVSEAVWLLGLERNAASILGASYAPLLQNLNSYEWAPDLISFDANPAQDVLSTSWHLIQLFSNTRMTQTLPAKADAAFGPLYWAAGVNAPINQRIWKAAVYNSTGDVPVTLHFDGVPEGCVGNLTVLTAPNATAENTIGSNVVMTNITRLTAGSEGFMFSLPDLSIALFTTEG